MSARFDRLAWRTSIRKRGLIGAIVHDVRSRIAFKLYVRTLRIISQPEAAQ